MLEFITGPILSRVFAGGLPTDIKRPLHITQEHFPGIDFSSIESDQDLYPQMHPVSDSEFGFESDEAAEQRGQKFLQWLLAR